MLVGIAAFGLVLFDRGDQLTSAWFGAFFFYWLVVALALLAFQIYCYWRVAEKCGYAGAWSLLMLVPVANIVISLIWVFSEWPIEAELKRLRGSVQ